MSRVLADGRRETSNQRRERKAREGPCACRDGIPCLLCYGAMNIHQQLAVRDRVGIAGQRDDHVQHHRQVEDVPLPEEHYRRKPSNRDR